MSGERKDLDPAAQVASELRARLRAMGGDEVVELCAQLLSIYVVEGVLPLSRASDSSDLAADSGGRNLAHGVRLRASVNDGYVDRGERAWQDHAALTRRASRSSR